ncbi:efflux RND transporter permease subunit [Synechococcus sp. RSCCF101]|uniref:efflux RND transporter permease subunit n=1 Tax=Synechococcus sp. RSCCF101 TaxID=2511069 RepID=UPI0012446D97|nr:efflux RND transporter permease subunit [Synechococcus sp. RSCCF101]QEY32504.1 efflux RND transporter permease subunit [Synechococcus sp. RSCCF101]
MSLSDTFIKRPVLTTVCSILIVVAGLISLPLLPVENLPQIAPPTVNVSANFAGGSAETVEQAVTIPLEEAINGVPGADYITSQSSGSGQSSITVTFDEGTDINIDQVNVLNLVNQANPQLPETVRSTGVSVTQSNPSFLAVYQVVADGNRYTQEFLNGLVQLNLLYPLERVKGIQAPINPWGGGVPSFNLYLDPKKLASFSLTAGDVINALGEQNVVVAAGSVGGPPSLPQQAFTYPIEIRGYLSSVEEFNDVILGRTPDGNTIRVRDVGSAQFGINSYFLKGIDLAGNVAIGVPVQQTFGSNAIDVATAAEAVIDEFRRTVPPGVKVIKVFDQTQFIRSSIEGVVDALGLAILLVVLILFLFLQDWRTTVIPGLAIPISLVGSFAFVLVFGFSLNQLTMLGLVLAVGLVVDDAIVVVEAVAANLEKGMPPRQAALSCMGELIGALVATSLVLMTVFLPVAAYPGSIGIIYRQFALTVAFAILISTFNALTFSPMMGGLILKGRSEGQEIAPSGPVWPVLGALVGLAAGHFLGGGFWFVAGAVLGAVVGSQLTPIFHRFNLAFGRLERFYSRFVVRMIQWRRWVLVALAAGLVITILGFRASPQGFIPNTDQGFGFGFWQLRNGASLEQTYQTGLKIQRILAEEEDVDAVFLAPGYSFTGPATNQGAAFLGLKPLDERRGKEHSAEAVFGRLNKRFAEELPTAFAAFGNPPAVPGFSPQGGFYYQFFDKSGTLDLDTFGQLASEYVNAARQTGKFQPIYDQFVLAPEFEISIDRDILGALDVDYAEAMNSIGALAGSAYSGLTYQDNQVRQVYVQATAENRDTLSDITSYYVKDRSGNLVAASLFMSVKVVDAPTSILHYNLARSIQIQGDAAPGVTSDEAYGTLDQLVRKLNLNSIGTAFTGLTRLQLASGSAAVVIFALGILVVYLVLSAQYESYITPITILMTVPLAMLGALLFLGLRGISLDIFGQVGLLTLIGLAAKNGILIVELAEQRVSRGEAPAQAAQEAASSRLRPILMTAIASLAGFFPLVVATSAGAAFQQSIGTVIFGGVLVATLLSLIVVPAFYVAIKGVERRLFRGPAPQPPEPPQMPAT